MSTHWIDGRKIGRNEPCPCGASNKFKDCCELFAKEKVNTVNDPIGAYVSSHELWIKRQPALDPILSELALFDSKDFFQFLCKVGVVLHEEIHGQTPKLEIGLLRLILEDDWYRKVLLWLGSKKRLKAIHRPLILATLRFLLNANTAGKLVKGHEKEIGPILLDINSVGLERDYTERVKKATNEKEHQRILFASMVRLGFYSNTEDFGSSIARYWAIHMHGFRAVKNKFPGEYYDFESSFRDEFVLSFSETLSLTFGIIQHYKQNIEKFFIRPEDFLIGESFFSNVNEQLRSRAYNVFLYLATTWDEHVLAITNQFSKIGNNNIQQFSSFYDHPLMEIAPGSFFPIDMDFLEYKISEGAYWQLFNQLKNRGKQKELKKLRSSMGHAVEWYAGELLKSAFSVSLESTKEIWLDWDGEVISKDKGYSIPDAIIIEGDTAFIIEVTSTSLLPSEIISGEPDLLETGLKRIWFERTEQSPGKLRQLQDSIEALITKKTELQGGQDIQSKRFIPILVTLRSVPQITALNHWYRELMMDNDLTQSFAENVQIIDLDELERLVSLKIQGVSWKEVFQKKYVSSQSNNSVHNFLHSHGYKAQRTGLVKSWLREVFDITARTLFNKPFVPQEPDSNTKASPLRGQDSNL